MVDNGSTDDSTADDSNNKDYAAADDSNDEDYATESDAAGSKRRGRSHSRKQIKQAKKIKYSNEKKPLYLSPQYLILNNCRNLV